MRRDCFSFTDDGIAFHPEAKIKKYTSIGMANTIITNNGDIQQCMNIKSKANPHLRCKNPAIHGEFCGVHHKVPRKWEPGTQKLSRKQKHLQELKPVIERIQKWWRFYGPLHLVRTRGPAYYDRTQSVNDADFFSCDKIQDISGAMFFSYRCDDKHIYSFDIRSIHSLNVNARHAGRIPENPYNRSEISSSVVARVSVIVNILKKNGVSVDWAPITPPTPEQQFRMKVVDVFHTINELNYYSSPDWFLNLDARAHRKFYSELHDIWIHRAGLSLTQKSAIIPGFQTKIFRSAPWTLRDVPLETVAKLNLNTIRLFVESAHDMSDRILGAMYVVTALTLVSTGARGAYPWLYETVEPIAAAPFPAAAAPAAVPLNWLNEFIHNHIANIPALQLPGPQQ